MPKLIELGWNFNPARVVLVVSLLIVITHRSPCFIVVKVHLLPQGSAALPRVDELSGELVAEADVVWAAAPLPVADARSGAWPRVGVGSTTSLVAVVACTRLYAALAARPCDRVRNRSTRDGVDERRLSTSCNKNTTLSTGLKTKKGSLHFVWARKCMKLLEVEEHDFDTR